MKKMEKRGQFFILSALILSAIVLSLVDVGNYDHVNKEPEKFYDLSYEVKEEVGKVIDYGVYSTQDKLGDFTARIAENIRNQDPESEFIFIYGDKNNVQVENYGQDSASITDSTGSTTNAQAGGENIENSVSIAIGNTHFGQNVNQDRKLFSDNFNQPINNPGDNIRVNIKGQDYTFNLADNQQFYMIIKKSSGEENFVDLK